MAARPDKIAASLAELSFLIDLYFSIYSFASLVLPCDNASTACL